MQKSSGRELQRGYMAHLRWHHYINSLSPAALSNRRPQVGPHKTEVLSSIPSFFHRIICILQKVEKDNRNIDIIPFLGRRILKPAEDATETEKTKGIGDLLVSDFDGKQYLVTPNRKEHVSELYDGSEGSLMRRLNLCPRLIEVYQMVSGRKQHVSGGMGSENRLLCTCHPSQPFSSGHGDRSGDYQYGDQGSGLGFGQTFPGHDMKLNGGRGSSSSSSPSSGSCSGGHSSYYPPPPSSSSNPSSPSSSHRITDYDGSDSKNLGSSGGGGAATPSGGSGGSGSGGGSGSTAEDTSMLESVSSSSDVGSDVEGEDGVLGKRKSKRTKSKSNKRHHSGEDKSAGIDPWKDLNRHISQTKKAVEAQWKRKLESQNHQIIALTGKLKTAEEKLITQNLQFQQEKDNNKRLWFRLDQLEAHLKKVTKQQFQAADL